MILSKRTRDLPSNQSSAHTPSGPTTLDATTGLRYSLIQDLAPGNVTRKVSGNSSFVIKKPSPRKHALRVK